MAGIAYLNQHQITPVLNAAVNDLAREAPAEPFDFLINALLKAAKARMKKQMEMQEWLEKKEEKALKALEEEENVRKKMQVSKGCLIKKIRDRAGQMHLT